MSIKQDFLPRGVTEEDILIEPRKALSPSALKALLQKAGLKVTTQRMAVLKILNQGPRYHKTAQDILDEAKRICPAIGFATVYRFLKKLMRAHVLTEISMGAGASCYELRSNQFHYHIACVKCGKIVEFKSQTIEKALERIVRERNYIMQNQLVEIYIICDTEKCRSAGGRLVR